MAGSDTAAAPGEDYSDSGTSTGSDTGDEYSDSGISARIVGAPSDPLTAGTGGPTPGQSSSSGTDASSGDGGISARWIDLPSQPLTAGGNEAGVSAATPLTAADTFNLAVGGALDLAAMPAQIAPLDQLSAYRIGQHAGFDNAPTPPLAPLTGDMPTVPRATLPPDLRYDYAQQLLADPSYDPLLYAEELVGTAWKATTDDAPGAAHWQGAQLTNAAKAIADGLPSHDDLDAYGSYIAWQVYGDTLTPDMVALVKSNMADAWAQTGIHPEDLIKVADANPDFQQALATPPAPPPPVGLLTPKDIAPDVTDLGIVWMGPGGPKAPAPEAVPLAPHQDTIKPNQGEETNPPPATVAGHTTTPEGGIKLDTTLPEAQQQVLEQTGIPDLQQAYEALHRGETLQAVGHGGVGLANALSLFTPARGTVREGTELAAAGAGMIGRLGGALFAEHFMTPAERAAWAANKSAAELARGSIRAETGMARRDGETDSAVMEQYRKQMAPLLEQHRRFIADTGAWGRETATAKQAWIDAGNDPDAFTPARPAPAGDPLQALIDHVEQRPGGARLAPDAPLYPVADAMRSRYQGMRQQIEAQWPDMTGFVEDYYRHLWKSDRDFDRVTGNGRQGSGASLNHRTIPTYYDGILRGLEPKVIDPIDNLLHYTQGMRDYIAARRILDTATDAGQVYYATKPANLGDRPLAGFASQRMRVFEDKDGNPAAYTERAYATPGFAKVYNRWVGKGFNRWPVAGAVYRKLQASSNAMTGMALGLSGYHAVNIAKEVGASGLAHGLGEFDNGELARGLADMGISAAVLPKLAGGLAKGARFQSVYLRQAPDATPLEQQLADIFAKAGGRALGRGEEYYIGTAKSLLRSWRNGTLPFELKEDLRAVAGSTEEPAARRALLSVPRAIGLAAKEFGRVANTLSEPLFDYAIPKLKAAAWADEMEAFLRAHPAATDEETLSTARTLADSMDDRFGEMVQDNLFWPRWVKQLANLGLVSVGWEYGTLRAFGRGLDDALNGRFTTRVRWLTAFPIMMAIQATAYQAFKTATTPFSTGWANFVTPRTGGTLPSGNPELALPPGPEKEALQWYSLLRRADSLPLMGQSAVWYGEHKLNPFARSVLDFFKSRTMGEWLDKLVGNAAPIVMQSPRQRGSALSGVERWFGVRQAPRAVSEPALLDQQLDRKLLRDARTEAWRQYHQDRNLAEPKGVSPPAWLFDPGNTGGRRGRRGYNPGQ